MVAIQSEDITTLSRIDDVTDEHLENGDSEHVTNHYWFVHPVIIQKLVDYCRKHGCNNVIDVGCSRKAFPVATHCIDFSDVISSVDGIPIENKMKIDIDFQQIPMDNQYFDFCYCRHTLEDIQNPNFAFQEMVRCSRRGYIETPSPLIEVQRRVDAMSMNGDENINYCGYIHHRYIVWTDRKTNTLYFLPKYPIIEYTSFLGPFIKRLTYIANTYPVYWNNYYLWDDLNNLPNVFVYKNGVNFVVQTDYAPLLYEAIMSSFENTQHFINSV